MNSLMLQDELVEAAKAVKRAEDALVLAREERDQAMRVARFNGFSLRRVADLAGVSHQTVANVVAARAATTTSQPVPPVE